MGLRIIAGAVWKTTPICNARPKGVVIERGSSVFETNRNVKSLEIRGYNRCNRHFRRFFE